MTFSRIIARARVQSEVLSQAKGKGRTVRSLTFHSLRHSFNSAMANAGVAQEIRQKLTGHSSAEMNKHYTHHELESLRAGVPKRIEHGIESEQRGSQRHARSATAPYREQFLHSSDGAVGLSICAATRECRLFAVCA
jgi:hypothetical protein